MVERKTIESDRFKNLNKFIRQNKKIDFKVVDLLNSKKLEALNWKGIEGNNRHDTLKLVKAYQRLARLLQENNSKIIVSLLKKNIHSAIQIAAIPRQQFMKNHTKLFGDDIELMKQVYTRATAIRSQVLLKYINIVQNSQRHTKAVKTISAK